MVDGNFDVTYPVLGIIGAVLIRYCVVSFADSAFVGALGL